MARGGNSLLRPCSATVGAGEALVITGGDGAGKTTLLTLLCGLTTPSAGTVLIGGRTPDERSPSFRSTVAGMLGLPPLARDVTVEEQLRLVAVSWGAPASGPTGPHTIAQRLLTRLQIVPLADRFPPHDLSSGQLQLTGLALTLARPPDLLVLDEPEQRLDTERRGVVAALLAEMRDEGRCLVVSTHSAQIVDGLRDAGPGPRRGTSTSRWSALPSRLHRLANPPVGLLPVGFAATSLLSISLSPIPWSATTVGAAFWAVCALLSALMMPRLLVRLRGDALLVHARRGDLGTAAGSSGEVGHAVATFRPLPRVGRRLDAVQAGVPFILTITRRDIVGGLRTPVRGAVGTSAVVASAVLIVLSFALPAGVMWVATATAAVWGFASLGVVSDGFRYAAQGAGGPPLHGVSIARLMTSHAALPALLVVLWQVEAIVLRTRRRLRSG